MPCATQGGGCASGLCPLCANFASAGRSAGCRSYGGPMLTRRRAGLVVLAVAAGVLTVAIGTALLALLLRFMAADAGCGGGPSGTAVALGAPGGAAVAGATEYGGPGDPSSGVLGASGVNLLSHPDSYAELGGTTFQTATMLGGLPY